MVVSFIQRHPKIAAGHIRAEDNLGAMILEILELYGTKFNFNRVGIAVDNGGSYFEKAAYQAIDENRWKKICVRDPNDPTNNIAKASHQNDKIIKVFGDAFDALTTRCYLVHTRIQAGESAPWGTSCGSILDAIIERPNTTIRERLHDVWTEAMAGAINPDDPMTIQRPILTPPKPRKPNRAERRAAKRAKDAEMKGKAEDSKKGLDERISSPRPPKRRAPTAITTGTKDSPIVLDDSPSVSPPRLTPRRVPSPVKRIYASRNVGDLAL